MNSARPATNRAIRLARTLHFGSSEHFRKLAALWVLAALVAATAAAEASLPASSQNHLEVLYEWRRLNYEGNAEATEDYDWRNNVLGAVRRYKDSLYLSVPRWRGGVPATLNVVEHVSGTSEAASPLLRPFPDLKMNRIGDCDAFQNVVALELSPDGRLWVADSGTAAIFAAPVRKCNAKVIAYNLKASPATEVYRHEFSNVIAPTILNTLFMHMVLDFSTSSRSSSGLPMPVVYLSDINTGHLVSLDTATNHSWRIFSSQMERKNTKLKMAGQDFIMTFGVNGIALISNKTNPSESRMLFGNLEKELYSLSTSQLSTLEHAADVSELAVRLGKRNSGSDAMTSDDSGVLYYGLLENTAAMMWNSSAGSFYHNRELLARDQEWLQWINDLFVDDGHLWMVSNKFHTFTWSEFSENEANFRISRIPLPNPRAQSYVHVFVSSASRLSFQHFMVLFSVIFLMSL